MAKPRGSVHGNSKRYTQARAALAVARANRARRRQANAAGGLATATLPDPDRAGPVAARRAAPAAIAAAADVAVPRATVPSRAPVAGAAAAPAPAAAARVAGGGQALTQIEPGPALEGPAGAVGAWVDAVAHTRADRERLLLRRSRAQLAAAVLDMEDQLAAQILQMQAHLAAAAALIAQLSANR